MSPTARARQAVTAPDVSALEERLTYTGEDNMMMGTDYGHHDHATDLEGPRNLKTAGGIIARVYDKIVDAKPRAAYAL